MLQYLKQEKVCINEMHDFRRKLQFPDSKFTKLLQSFNFLSIFFCMVINVYFSFKIWECRWIKKLHNPPTRYPRFLLLRCYLGLATENNIINHSWEQAKSQLEKCIINQIRCAAWLNKNPSHCINKLYQFLHHYFILLRYSCMH